MQSARPHFIVIRRDANHASSNGVSASVVPFILHPLRVPPPPSCSADAPLPPGVQ